MKNLYFDQIFNFKITSAKKLQNSSYLEDLTGLFEKSASSIDSGVDYYFDSQYYLKNPKSSPNSSYEEFIKEFKTTFMFSSPEKVHIIRGKAGVGKTLFFKRGIQKLLRDESEHKDKYIKLGVDFKNIDSMEKIDDYSEYIYKRLCSSAIDAIRQLGENIFNEFSKKYQNYCCGLYDTPFAKLYPVFYFCKYIYKKYDKPGIIILDNIDLASVTVQRKVFKATSIVCEEIHSFMNVQNSKDTYRIYFAMRPETYLHSDEMCIGKVINFPLPDIQAISLEIIKNALSKTAKDFDINDRLKCQVTYYNIITHEMVEASTFLDISNYFIQLLTYFFENLWTDSYYSNRLGTCQDFHCNISNYNIRLFLNFLADTLTNGGFKPLTKEFTENPYTWHYNVFDYIEMIIRGRWSVFPGNKHIDGEGGNKAPIVFNVFDTSLYSNTQADKVKHFMLFLHILERLNEKARDDSILYSQLETDLSSFYEKENIKKAVQELTFVRIIYSFGEGDENIASKQSYEEVEINASTQLNLTDSGTFYIEKFVCEFEYLYQMSLSSLMPSFYVELLKDCWMSEKELTVLYFLTGIFYILKINLDNLDNNNLQDYRKLFCLDNASSKPYRRMVDSFINVMNKKIQSAETKEIKSVDKLKDILTQAKALQKNILEYFKEKLGE